MTREEAEQKLIEETGLTLSDLPDCIPIEEFINEDDELDYEGISRW